MAWPRTTAFLAEYLGTWVYTTLCRTLRVTTSGCEQLEGLWERHAAICVATWHSQLLLPIFRHRFGDGVVIVSQHADGELIARVVRRLGYRCARGSTTRGGARALAELIRFVRQGHDLGVTPDGPRGPRYAVQPGVVYLGQKTGVPIVPVGVGYSRCWEFNSWDRFRLPKPWARAHLAYGPAIQVPSSIPDDGREDWRLRVETAMKRATREAEEAVGLTPEVT